jgi:hypothetical protein
MALKAAHSSTMLEEVVSSDVRLHAQGKYVGGHHRIPVDDES